MEKLINFSLRELYRHPRTKRAKRAINRLRNILSKRFHVNADNIWISPKINELIWAKGFTEIPRVLPLRIIIEENKLRAFLQSEEVPKEEPAKKPKKEEKPSKEKQAEKEEKEEEKAKKLAEKKAAEQAAEKAAIKRKLDK